jgi:endonuclease YncB( thermonuclease family)
MTKMICSGKTRPRQSIFLSLLVLLLLSVSLSSQANAPQSFTGKVVGGSDGDTVKVMREGRAVKIRLHGINCPEKKQPYGPRAKGIYG